MLRHFKRKDGVGVVIRDQRLRQIRLNERRSRYLKLSGVDVLSVEAEDVAPTDGLSGSLGGKNAAQQGRVQGRPC